MIPLFDYGNIKEEHKAAAEECAKLIEQSNPSMATFIRERFEIIEPKRLSLEDSEFYKIAKQLNITVGQQGYTVGSDGVQIPMVAVFAEITKLDDFLTNYKNLLCNK